MLIKTLLDRVKNSEASEKWYISLPIMENTMLDPFFFFFKVSSIIHCVVFTKRKWHQQIEVSHIRWSTISNSSYGINLSAYQWVNRYDKHSTQTLQDTTQTRKRIGNFVCGNMNGAKEHYAKGNSPWTGRPEVPSSCLSN